MLAMMANRCVPCQYIINTLIKHKNLGTAWQYRPPLTRHVLKHLLFIMGNNYVL